MTPPEQSNIRNPRGEDLLAATLLEVRAQPMGSDFPMCLVARYDNLNLGTAYGWTFAQGLRRLADLLELDRDAPLPAAAASYDLSSPLRAALHLRLDNWLDVSLGRRDDELLTLFEALLGREAPR